MKKRVFSAKTKASIVLEVLKGEKELNVIASEKEIAPNQIRKWKTEFIGNAELVFDNKRDKEYKEKEQEFASKEGELYKNIGQLTTQINWLKKKSEELLGTDWESKFTPRPKG